jgi:ligand-binding SRPBCC domain-containing protein
VIVNVCPASVTRASPDRVWSVLSAPEQFGGWTDATFLSSDPAGPVVPGQTIHLTATSFGRNWPVDIAVRNVDPQRRWIDLVVRLPFGIDNHEHLTLTETAEGGTLVRFN